MYQGQEQTDERKETVRHLYIHRMMPVARLASVFLHPRVKPLSGVEVERKLHYSD